MLKHCGTELIQTERLILRRFLVSDFEDMYNNWASDATVSRYLTWKPHENKKRTKAILKDWSKAYSSRSCYNWCITLKNDGTAVGSIGVVSLCEELDSCQIGYCLTQKLWGQGIMTEALQAVLRFLFEDVGIVRVSAVHHIENPASGRVMQKSGMNYIGIVHKGAKTNDGQFCDIALYEILNKCDI